MIDYLQACQLACAYYKEKYDICSLASAQENSQSWFFCGGLPGQIQIGGKIIAVKKEDGEITPIMLPSKENVAMLREAGDIDLPEAFLGKTDCDKSKF